jgi:hypothetical protein
MSGSSVSSDESCSQELLHPIPTPEQNKKTNNLDNNTSEFLGNMSCQPLYQPMGKQLKRTSSSMQSSFLPSHGREKSSSIPEIIVTTAGADTELSAVTTVNNNLSISEGNIVPETTTCFLKSTESAMGIRLIYEDAPNKTGELVLDTIFNLIKGNGGWNACVGKGKKMQFFELVAKRLFDKNNGMLNHQ